MKDQRNVPNHWPGVALHERSMSCDPSSWRLTRCAETIGIQAIVRRATTFIRSTTATGYGNDDGHDAHALLPKNFRTVSQAIFEKYVLRDWDSSEGDFRPFQES